MKLQRLLNHTVLLPIVLVMQSDVQAQWAIVGSGPVAHPVSSPTLQRSPYAWRAGTGAWGESLAEETLDEALSRAEREGLSQLEFLHLVIGGQAALRRERSIARRIREASFREPKTLATFDWQFNAKAIDRARIEDLASGEFIRRKANLVLAGQSGVGKSHIAQSIGERACVLGWRVRYTTSAALLEDLRRSLADQTLPSRVRYYARFDLLIITSLASIASKPGSPAGRQPALQSDRPAAAAPAPREYIHMYHIPDEKWPSFHKKGISKGISEAKERRRPLSRPCRNSICEFHLRSVGTTGFEPATS